MNGIVSDSDREEEPEEIKRVDKKQFAKAIISSNDKLQLLQRLNNYKHLFKNDEWERLPNASSLTDIFFPKTSSKAIQDLDLTGSILDLNSIQCSSRGLRRRTFAATHPYLVDSIKYLGLVSIKHLNDYFASDPNLENILKILNNSYLKLKKKYPKDDKYLKRDFYQVYGESKRNNDAANNANQNPDLHFPNFDNLQDDSQYVPPTSQAVLSAPQDNDDYMSDNNDYMSDTSDHRSYLGHNRPINSHKKPLILNDILSDSSDDDLITRRAHNLIIIDENDNELNDNELNDNDLNNANDLSDASSSEFTSDSDSDTLVRVGGKLLKSKSVLRGALPESAKRLNFYKNSSANKVRGKKHQETLTEARRGLARKKIAKTDRPKESFLGFIDDNPDAEESYDVPPMIDEGILSPDDSRLSLDIFDVLSDVSATDNTDNDDSQIFDYDPREYKAEVIFDNDILENDIFDNVGSTQNKSIDLGIIENAVEVSDMTDYEGYESILELDRINPLTSGTPRMKRKNTKNRLTNTGSNRSSLTSKKRLGDSSINLGFSKSSRRPKSLIGSSRSRSSNSSTKSKVSSHSSSSKKSSKKDVNQSDSKRRKIRNFSASRSSAYATLNFKSIKKPIPTVELKRSIPKRSTPDLEGFQVDKTALTSKYLFLRNPHQSTLQFELESNEPAYNKALTPFKMHNASKIISSFPKDFILTLIDIDELQKLKKGKTLVSNKDSISITLVGNSFVLSTFNTFQANVNLEAALSIIQRIIKDQSKLMIESISCEVYNALGGLLQWQVIDQSKPSDKVWKLTNSILSTLSSAYTTDAARISTLLYPIFILLFYVLILLEEINFSLERRLKELRASYLQVCDAYWPLFFGNFHLQEIETIVWQKTRESESFHIMYKLLSSDNKLWYLINNSIPLISKSCDELLEDVVSLITFIPPKSYNWSCFYTVYQRIVDEEDSLIYNRFLDAVELLHHRFSWPIEEKMIMTLYNTITSRKFKNFSDEWVEPELIGRIRSRNDMPDLSFFERFMKFLYGCISNFETYNRRLITKLFTSSKYKFEPNRDHFIMFVNRMNFILLLFQCSKENLNAQLTSLVQSVKGLQDYNILSISVTSLSLFTEISIEKNSNLPIDCYVVLLDELNSSYLHIPRIKSIWTTFVKALEILLENRQESFVQLFVKAQDLPDKFARSVHTILLSCLERLSGLDATLLRDLEFKLQQSLQARMGSYSVGVHNLKLQDFLITSLIDLWLKTISLLPDPNWDKLILQTLPYIGNQLLRERFNLYFYLVMLRYSSLTRSKDILINTILRDLVSMTSSEYLCQIILQLNISKSEEILQLSKDEIKNLPSINAVGVKKKLIVSFINNISRSKSTHKAVKEIYIIEILKGLNSEFDLNHGNQWYRDFCRTAILQVQKMCQPFLTKKELLHSLANKLGILPEELDQFAWIQKPVVQKLSEIHQEFSHALTYNRDYHQSLNKLIFSEPDLAYHLVSVYVLAISLNQTEKWKHLYYLLKFYLQLLETRQFRLNTPGFSKFLKMLSEIPYLSSSKCSELESIYRLQSLAIILQILEHSYVLFDGYKDQILVNVCSSAFLQAILQSKSNGSGSVNTVYSFIKPFEVFQGTLQSSVVVQELFDADTINSVNTNLRERIAILRNINLEYENPNSINSSQCLSFDL